jgi:predicted nucleic acid-binding protein
MTDYVVDASVAAKWFFEERYTDQALSLLEDRNRLHAPDFLLVELDSVICKRIRRDEISEDEAQEVRAGFRKMPFQFHSFGILLDPAYELAVKTGCSVYDGLYVALAALLDAKIVTADKKLYDGLRESALSENVEWIEGLRQAE